MTLVKQKGSRIYSSATGERDIYVDGVKFGNTFMYIADKATNAAGWVPTAGATTLTESGAVAFGNASNPLGTSDSSVDLSAAGARFDGSGTGVYDVTTNDLIIEVVCKVSTNAAIRGVFAKAIFSSPSIRGYNFQLTAGHVPRFHIGQVASGTVADIDGNAVGTNSWHHFMVFMDTSEASTNGSQVYANGQRSGTGTDVSGVGTLTNVGTFRVGVEADTFANNFDEEIAFISMWAAGSGSNPGGARNLEVWNKIASERYLRYVNGDLVK